MIRDLTKNVNDYATAMRQSTEVKNEAEAFIKKNYVSGSKIYDEAMKSCTATFNEATRPLKQAYVDAVQKEIEEAKSRLAAVIGTAIPDDFMKIVPMISSMTNFEKMAILKKYENNYMCMKMLHNGDDSFRTLEHILDDIDDLSEQLSKVTHISVDCYDAKLMQSGSWIDNVSDEVQNFIDKYSMKGGEE